MHSADLKDYVQFSEEGPARHSVFESGRMLAELVCLSRGQSLGPVSDPDADALLTIVAGEAALQVDGERTRLGQWGCALVPAGATLVVANASPDPLVALRVAAPPPRVLSG